MKRILFITSSSINGGAQKHIRDMFLRITKKGYDTYLVAPEGWLTNELSLYKEKVFILSANIKNLFSLMTIMDKIKPDIVNTFILSGGIFGYSAWLKKQYGKIFITVNNPIIYDGISRIKSKIYPLLYKYMSMKCTAFLVKSETVKNEVNQTISKNKAKSIKNGIDFGIFDKDILGTLKKELSLSDNDILISNVGVLEERKGQNYLIKAIEKITAIHDNVYLAIAGEGSYRETLETLIRDCKIENKVFLLGNRKDINNILASTDIFVLSSLHEGLPNALMEAMSMKKACISTSVGGARELVDDAVEGFIIEPKDEKQIYDKLICLINDEELKQFIANNAYNKIRQLYDIDKVVDELLNIYGI